VVAADSRGVQREGHRLPQCQFQLGLLQGDLPPLLQMLRDHAHDCPVALPLTCARGWGWGVAWARGWGWGGACARGWGGGLGGGGGAAGVAVEYDRGRPPPMRLPPVCRSQPKYAAPSATARSSDGLVSTSGCQSPPYQFHITSSSRSRSACGWKTPPLNRIA